MKYTLYNRVGSAGAAVEALLCSKDIEFDLIEIASISNTPVPDSFSDVNPWKQVPVLELPDSTRISETAAILIYLASAHPASNIGPPVESSAFGTFARWIVFTSVNIHEAFSRKIYPSRFTVNPDGEQDVIAAASNRLETSLTLLDQTIAGPYLFGDQLSAADIYFSMFYLWNGGRFELPALKTLNTALLQERAIASVWRRHFAQDLAQCH